MLVFNDSINSNHELDNSKRFWIKNTISNVKINKSKSKNDTNLIKKIIINQDIYENKFSKKNSKKSSKKNSKNKLKNLNKNSYNSLPNSQYNGKKQTKKAKKIRRANK